MQDVGIACLSPGFVTQDPAMQEQVQKSIELREQQRKIIESRLHKSTMKSHVEAAAMEAAAENSPASPRPVSSARRKGPPPGLSITAPSAHQFASEPRVIQSAPLHQTFTGLRPSVPAHTHPLSRQILDQNHHAAPVPPYQSRQGGTRLPPIHDVFNSGGDSNLYAPIGLPSPGLPQRSATLPQPGGNHNVNNNNVLANPASASAAAGTSARAGEREFRSADDASRFLSDGRDPKLVHYGGHQPPTPPTPVQTGDAAPAPSSAPFRGGAGEAVAASTGRGGRRRNREEYEDGQADEDEEEYATKRQGRARRPEGQMRGEEEARNEGERAKRKKDEFMALCARAWDLLHA